METSYQLSIIIPTRNHSQLVADLLNSLARLYPVAYRWEVLVIDNGSTDTTVETVTSLISSLPFEIRCICEPNPGLHNGRHRGAREAKGKYLAYLDDDVLVTETWLSGINQLAAGNADTVVGRILPKWEYPPPRWLLKLTREPGYLSLLNFGTTGCYVDPSFVYGDNFFIPSQLVFDLQGFHPDSLPAEMLRFRGDGESALMAMFKKAGLSAWYEPAATVFHRIPKERMCLEYLRKREYAQGISDSFTEIRARHFDPSMLSQLSLPPTDMPNKNIKYYLQKTRKASLQQIWKSLITRVKKITPMSQTYVKNQLRQAWWSGYKWHQHEAITDPELITWILRENYWNGRP